MAINFPATPNDNDEHTTAEGVTYRYSASVGAWLIVPTTVNLGPAFEQANSAFTKANTANSDAVAAFLTANTVWIHANQAFAKANSALANTSGVTFDGVLNISNNVTTQGINVISNVISLGTAMNILPNGMIMILGDLNMLT